jgi:PAS domain S-box-containing protein
MSHRPPQLEGCGWETLDLEDDRPIRVLYVEDNVDLAHLVSEQLERHGEMAVDTATDAERGLEALDETIDCVLCDYEMPGPDGLEFLEMVRERHPTLPFLLFTGEGSERVAADAISAGVTDYVQKQTGTEQYQLLANRIEKAVSKQRAERRIERLQRRVRKLIQHSTDVITVLGPDGTIAFQSPSVERILGFEPSEMVGENAFDFVHPDDQMDVVEAFDRGIEQPDELVEVEWRARTADGDWCWLHSVGTNRLDDPDVNGFVVNHRDVTDVRERKRQLERQNERLERFASVVSHDIRGPLDRARGWVEVALEDDDPEALERSLLAHDRMESIVDDTLTLAREGAVVEQPIPVAVDVVAREAWQSVDAPAASLEIESDAVLEADEDRLRRLFENLFRNAVEHGGDGVTIRVSISEDALIVTDDGGGVDPAQRNEVFEFGHTTADDGTGFGLSIVREIAIAHGWSVNLTESDDGGARFEFRGVERGPRSAV